MHNLKLEIKKILQLLLGFENYLLIFQKYLFFFSSPFFKRVSYYRNKFKELHYLISLIKKGDICVDIGANIGLYSYRMANAVGTLGKVFSFEPVSMNYQALLKGINSKYDDIILFEKKIVSDEIKDLTIIMPKKNGVLLQGLSHIANPETEEDGICEQVSTTTLDNYFSCFQKKINFIKCDVEGHEFSVLQGARNILLSHKPIILCEIWNNPKLPFVFEYLEGLGYSSFYVDQFKLRNVDKSKQDWKTKNDYFFLPTRKN